MIIIFALPAVATILAILAMLAYLPAMWARLEAPYTPESTDAEAWATDLEWDLMPTESEQDDAQHAPYLRLAALGIVPDPWAMPLARVNVAPVLTLVVVDVEPMRRAA